MFHNSIAMGQLFKVTGVGIPMTLATFGQQIEISRGASIGRGEASDSHHGRKRFSLAAVVIIRLFGMHQLFQLGNTIQVSVLVQLANLFPFLQMKTLVSGMAVIEKRSGMLVGTPALIINQKFVRVTASTDHFTLVYL